MTRSLCLLAFVLAAAAARASDDGYYATKADYKAGRLTPGRPPAAPAVRDPDVGGENCASPTAIAALPFNDADDTTGNVSDVNALGKLCTDYAVVPGPDLVYTFTVGAANSVAFRVNPTNATYDPSIYVLGTCGDGNTCVNAADQCFRSGAAAQPPGCPDGDGDEDLPAFVYEAGTHALYVDSFYAAGASCSGQGSVQCGAGPYTLTVTGILPVHLERFEIE
jgi:hypothetical protein